jgi:hypothetical protein
LTETRLDHSLEERIQKLEDVIAIERLMSRYGECVDNNYDLVGLEQVLAPDLIWSSNAFGSYEGRDAYLAGQEEIGKGVAWAFHVMAPVRVTANGSTADGTFYLLMLGTFLTKGGTEREPIILTARYDNEFRRYDDGWRCSRMQVKFQQVSRLAEGWVREPFFSA